VFKAAGSEIPFFVTTQLDALKTHAGAVFATQCSLFSSFLFSMSFDAETAGSLRPVSYLYY